MQLLRRWGKVKEPDTMLDVKHILAAPALKRRQEQPFTHTLSKMRLQHKDSHRPSYVDGAKNRVLLQVYASTWTRQLKGIGYMFLEKRKDA